MIESLGPKLRKQRRRLGLTLDELAGRTGISKPYLSLIETSRVPNPPSDEKLRRLEQALGFASGELLTQAHLHRLLARAGRRGGRWLCHFGSVGHRCFLTTRSSPTGAAPG